MILIRTLRRFPVLLAIGAAPLLGAGVPLLAACGPFIDVSDAAFCPFVLEIFYIGITTGTSATTYDPAAGVSRLQMAAFLARTVDGVLKRGSRRAAMRQFWTPESEIVLRQTTVGAQPTGVESDGADIWVANSAGASVSRVRASDGRLLETWSGAASPAGVSVAMGYVFAAGETAPGSLYRIDPSQPAGAVTTVSTALGDLPILVAFDGGRLWTTNQLSSISIVTPDASLPWSVTTVTAGFQLPAGIVYDGSSIWVTDFEAGTFLKLDSRGAILQTVTVGTQPGQPVFDGSNFWVPNRGSASVSVIRGSSGAVLTVLTGNGLMAPEWAAFDGERVLITNYLNTNSVTLWKAASLTSLGVVATGAGTNPAFACSDGVNFWISLQGANRLARF